MMNIFIDTELFIRVGEVRLGCIEASVHVTLSSPELTQCISEKVVEIETEYKLEDINKLQNIAIARKAYKIAGNDPNRYRPSAESLYRRIVKGYGLYRINNVVDTLNLISLKSGISIGGYDLEVIKGDIFFGIGEAGEMYEGIGRGALNISWLPVLRDATGAFGSPTSDSERTKITDNTVRILFVFFDFGCYLNLDESMNQCIVLLEKYCSASKIDQGILHFKQT